VTDQIYAVDNPRLAPAELTALRASLHEDRRFRLNQLREITRAPVPAGLRFTGAHAEVRRQLVTAAQTVLAETDAALLRMEKGRYGNCHHCGRAIGLERLRVHPQARYCTRCHHAAETAR
jgi:RNA polymerase-binding transcription factor DksA